VLLLEGITTAALGDVEMLALELVGILEADFLEVGMVGFLEAHFLDHCLFLTDPRSFLELLFRGFGSNLTQSTVPVLRIVSIRVRRFVRMFQVHCSIPVSEQLQCRQR
jgi:hypothetical protein